MSVLVTAAALVLAVLAMMALEAQLSAHNERVLRSQGALEPQDDVIGWMRLAYPLGFVAIGIAGALNPVLDRERLLWGFAVLTAAKALKFWAISSLGSRWSFRVLVLPESPLVTTGPYAHLRHPNYLAVFGEIAGFAMMVGALWTGVGSLLLFRVLVRRRIAIEENALENRRPEPGA